MTARLLPFAALLLFGAGWGLSLPLSKIAVSGGYMPFGLLFWQQVIVALLLGGIVALRRRRMPSGRGVWQVWIVIALLGAILPGAASYTAARHLPAGVISLVLSLVPMLAFPMALALGVDRFSAARLAGLALGLFGVALIALPDSALPEPAMLLFLPVALIAPVLYAMEGNYVARWGTGGMDPVQVLFGAALVGIAISGPVALGSGQWINPLPPYGAPDLALAASSVIHAGVYTGYVWLVGRTGAVFAAQVSYLVTGFGVFWAMLLLGERYSLWVWAAFGVMMAALMLVRPRPAAMHAPLAAGPKTATIAAGPQRSDDVRT